MARLFSSGFELNSITAGVEWNAVTGAGQTIDATIKRSGDYSYKVVSLNGESRFIDNDVTSGDIISRIWLYIDTTGDATVAILQHVNSTERATVALHSDRTLTLHEGNKDATQIGSASSALSEDTWYCIELLSDEGAATEIAARLNGSVFASGTTTVVQTINEVRVGIMDWATGYTLYFDDVAINDTTGTVQNSYPGITGKIVHMNPNAAGDNNGAVSGDYTSVDEVTPDDGTSIAVLDVANDILDVNCEASSAAGIGSSDTITLVQVGYRAAGVNANPRSGKVRIKSASGATVAESATNAVSSAAYETNAPTPFTYKLTSYTDPTTGIAWTPTGTNSLDNMQIGYEVIDAAPDTNLSTLWAVVEYVPAVAGSAVKGIFQTTNKFFGF